MEFTGERFIPEAGLDSDIEIEHLQRYYSVRKLVKGKTVLDAASGSGYGTNILAEYADQVYGLEISEEAVSYSKQKYQKDNLHYSQGSIASLPFADSSLDVVVSFETIEHVDEELQKAFVQEIRRVLKEDGILLMSSPDKRIYSDLPGYNNEHHVKEFYRDEFVNFLQPYFENICLYDQFTELSYLLVGENSNLERLSFNNASVEGKYIIALCSNADFINGISLGSLVVDGNMAFQNKINRIYSLQEEIDEKNEVIDDKNTLIYRTFNQMFQKEEQFDLEKNKRSADDKELHEKELAIQELSSKVRDLTEILKERDKKINELQGTLKRIKSTTGHKLLQKGYQIKDKLLLKK